MSWSGISHLTLQGPCGLHNLVQQMDQMLCLMHKCTSVFLDSQFSFCWIIVKINYALLVSVRSLVYFDQTQTRLHINVSAAFIWSWAIIQVIIQGLGKVVIKFEMQFSRGNIELAPWPLSKTHWLISPESRLLLNGSQHAVTEKEEYNLTPCHYYAYEPIICSFTSLWGYIYSSCSGASLCSSVWARANSHSSGAYISALYAWVIIGRGSG